jgi:hypothetical protein
LIGARCSPFGPKIAEALATVNDGRILDLIQLAKMIHFVQCWQPLGQRKKIWDQKKSEWLSDQTIMMFKDFYEKGISMNKAITSQAAPVKKIPT